MEFRKSEKCDIDDIMKIISQAQDYFKKQGIDQWQNNYPNPEVIENDIDNNESYVLIKDNKIVATTVISFRNEKTYDTIYEGKWITEGKYAVIHRIAIDNNYKGEGLSYKIIKYVEENAKNQNIYSVKVDTHEQNIPMQSMLKKNGFEYCGVIYLSYGAKRVAFEKVINS